MKRADDPVEKRLTKNQSVVSRKIADEFILVPIRQKAGDVESIYTLNEVAGRIWELIDGEKSLAEIRDIIVAEFEVSPGETETDIENFLAGLKKIGAVEEI